jgi:hypothetical protein
MSFCLLYGTVLGKDIFGREVKTEIKEYMIEENCSFELEGINGDIEISYWNEDTIYVEVKKIAKKQKDIDKIRAVVEEEKGKFRIYTEIEKSTSNVSIDYIIRIPRKIINVEVYGKNGDIKISKVDVPVKLSSINGSIKADNMKIIENISIKSGDIEIHNSEIIKNIEILNGDIELKNVGIIDAVSLQSGDINIIGDSTIKKVESKNGDIELELDKVIGEIELVNINGNIEVEISKEFDGSIEFSTKNGDVDIDDFDVKYIKKSWNSVEGRIGSGNNKIKATNINGSIELSKK